MLKKIIILNLITSYTIANEISPSENQELTTALNQNLYEPNYFSLLFGLIFVIALIYFTGILYQKLIKIKLSNSTNDTNTINIINTTTLGQGKNLHLIKINNSYCLIGATANNITFLKDIDIEENNQIKKDTNDKND